jgi:hypothetical protein
MTFSQKPPRDLQYAKTLLYNLSFFCHSEIIRDLHAQWYEGDRADWFWRVEATLDLEQFGYVRSEEERWKSYT